MLRIALPVLLAIALSAATGARAQKWVDEKGRVYYGEPPKGVNVKPAPMTGGAVSTPGAASQARSSSAPRTLPRERPFANAKDTVSPATKFQGAPPK